MNGNIDSIPLYAQDLIKKGAPDKITSKYKIKYTTPRFKIHSFRKEINESIVSFHVIKMEGSLFMWIGRDSEPNFADLSVAMLSPLQASPLSTKIIGPSMDESSVNLSIRLSKKLNKQVYVSCNVVLDRFALPLLDKSISEESKLHPEWF